MSVHPAILSRTLTAEFYRVNAMFFLVVIGLCFGFMSGVEHIALAGYFMSSPWLVLVPISGWIVYTVKIIAYNTNEVREERNRFMYSVPLLRPLPRIVSTVIVAFGQLSPAIIYGSFLAATALQHQQHVELAMIAITLVFLLIIVTWRLDRVLCFPAKEESTPKPVRWLDKTFAKPMTWMLTEGIVRSAPGLLYTTKLMTCLVIYAVTQLYVYDTYDERLYLMTACLAFSANLALVYQYQRFEVVQLLMMRSLPIPFGRRLLTFIATMAMLTFPEIAMLASNLAEYLSLRFYLYAVFFGFALMMFGYGALYVRDATFDSFTRWIFFVSMGLLLMILFAVPVWMLALVQGVLGIYLLRKNYYSFEVST